MSLKYTQGQNTQSPMHLELMVVRKCSFLNRGPSPPSDPLSCGEVWGLWHILLGLGKQEGPARAVKPELLEIWPFDLLTTTLLHQHPGPPQS